MHPRHRDGLLAAGGLTVLLGVAAVTVRFDPVLEPAAALLGVVGAVLLEVAFLRFPGRLLERWERRGVPVAGLLAVVAVGALAVRHAPVVVGALAWGLATYLVLLCCVLSGLGNPLSRVVAPADGDE